MNDHSLNHCLFQVKLAYSAKFATLAIECCVPAYLSLAILYKAFLKKTLDKKHEFPFDHVRCPLVGKPLTCLQARYVFILYNVNKLQTLTLRKSVYLAINVRNNLQAIIKSKLLSKL